MIKELLKPPQCAGELEQRLADLNRLLKGVQESQKNLPPGHLKVCQKKNYAEYYHITEIGSSSGRYIPVKERPLAARLAQKQYDNRLIKQLRREITLLGAYLRGSSSLSAIQELYENLCPARQSLIQPVTFTNKQVAEQWQKTGSNGKSFLEDTQKMFTANDDCVRSKSEVLIADALLRYEVPYRYEVPLKLKLRRGKAAVGADADNSSTLTFYPDFMCLNLRTRQEFYWEHFGMMDEVDYADKAIEKLNHYAENNIIPGRNLIITMETKAEPLNTRTVDKMIKEFLL